MQRFRANAESRTFYLVLLWVLISARPACAQSASGIEAAVALQEVLVDVIARCERSVVAIARARHGNGAEKLLSPDFLPHEFATGVVIDSRGMILTNYHVLGQVDQNDYAVWMDRRGYAARVKAADPWSDLAVLQIDVQDLSPIQMGDARTLNKGDLVLALGNPYAIARDGSVSATWGIVSNLARKAAPAQGDEAESASRTSLHHFGTLIQTDARLNLGSSGGALVNLQGKMVGLTTSLAALAGYERSAGYAIPIDEGMCRVIERLQQGREPQFGFLGVLVEPLADSHDSRAAASGVRLREIVPGTPAEKFGLSQGDVITHVDGRAIHDADSLIRHVSAVAAGRTTRLTIVRSDPIEGRMRHLTKDVVLSKKHIETVWPLIVEQRRPAWRGLTVDHATAIPLFYQRARQLDKDGCVAVVDVQPASRAWSLGIRPGYFVSHVEGQRVDSPQQFYRLAGRHQGPVRLTFTEPIRGSSLLTVPPPSSPPLQPALD